MPAHHFEFLVEELSMEAFLSAWLPRQIPDQRTFTVHPFRGKSDLLGKLEPRLRGYAAWLPDEYRIVILVDRDNADCLALKAHLEDVCDRVGFPTRRSSPHAWRAATCLAIEELEAWYFGDWEAVLAAYPRALPHVPTKARYRNPDSVAGGTWEAFERVMQQRGIFEGGLQKVGAAREIGAHADAVRSTPPSFRYLANVLSEAAN